MLKKGKDRTLRNLCCPPALRTTRSRHRQAGSTRWLQICTSRTWRFNDNCSSNNSSTIKLSRNSSPMTATNSTQPFQATLPCSKINSYNNSRRYSMITQYRSRQSTNLLQCHSSNIYNNSHSSSSSSNNKSRGYSTIAVANTVTI